ncbi:MAG TPA: membrane protein insertion efficiency factor YidD [Vicinamibacterales bacterium]
MTAKLLLWLIRAYQLLLSPYLGGCCRFTPSCSAYAAEAIYRHGAGRGSWLAIRRLARCHPFGRWGFDPVPAVAPGAEHRGARRTELAEGRTV